MSKRPNIVFIMTDHQRADSIGMIQDGKEVTPNLNKLSKEASTFTRAYNTCPLCVPARTALATGKYPTYNGVVFNDLRGVRAGDHKTVHQYFKEAGYSVGHVGINHIVVEPSLQQRVQFDMWVDDESYEEYAKEQGIETGRTNEYATEVVELQDGQYVKKKYSNTKTSVWPHPEKHFKDNYFTDKAIEFIQQQHEEPFALFVYFWAPHPPLKVPEPYASKFNPDALALPSNVGVASPGEPQGRRKGIAAQMAEGLTMEDWRKVWAAHLGLVNMADAAIGRILDELKQNGYEDNTIITFTSDHGDHLGQHNMYQKMEMYEQAINVPFILKAPSAHANVFDTPVSHLDILPTLLTMCDIKLPTGLDGISLYETITKGDKPAERPVFCQYSGNPALGDIRRAVINGCYKYIHDPKDTPELYDVISDPLEMNNIAQDESYHDIKEKLHKDAMEWAKRHGDWVEF